MLQLQQQGRQLQRPQCLQEAVWMMQLVQRRKQRRLLVDPMLHRAQQPVLPTRLHLTIGARSRHQSHLQRQAVPRQLPLVKLALWLPPQQPQR
jgi:glycine cleavage system pyridoxal-binding protein P